MASRKSISKHVCTASREATVDDLESLYVYRENLRSAIARLEELEQLRWRRLAIYKLALRHIKLVSAA
jgi:hypothetical protein